MIDGFGLSALLGLRFAQLSMGQCNRVNLLRYLLQDFGILIMDESMANVDEPTRHAILYTIKSTFPEAVFLYISHNVVEVSRFCDQIVVFRGADKSPQTLQVGGQDHREHQALDKEATRVAWGDFAAVSEPVGGIQEIEDLRLTLEGMAGQIQRYQ